MHNYKHAVYASQNWKRYKDKLMVWGMIENQPWINSARKETFFDVVQPTAKK